MSDSQIVSLLLEQRPISLAQWMAEPIETDSVRRMLPAVRQRLNEQLVIGQPTFELRLADLILHYWLGRDIHGLYANLSAVLSGSRQLALLELSVGQLYIACKHEHAWRHLDAGFTLSARLLDAEDYFTVLRRHELLRHLPLGSKSVQASSLTALLKEAQVIERLKGGRSRPPTGDSTHHDTLD